MRVTGSMLTSNLLSNLYNNLKNLNQYQYQISTNSKNPRLSDDPIASINTIQIGNDLSLNEQYNRNTSDATAWLTSTESSLSEMNDILARASELANQAATGTYTESQRDTILKEVQELQTQYVNLANTKFAGKYLFGGYNTTSNPFKVTGTTISYNSIADLSAATPAEVTAESKQVRQYKLNNGIDFDVSITGLQVMGSGADNVYNMFQGFIDSLKTSTVTPELSSYIQKFSDAQDQILSLISDVGGRQKRLELTKDRNDSENLNLSDLLNKTAGINIAEVITNYRTAENSYNAALQVGAKIIQLSLVDYLR